MQLTLNGYQQQVAAFRKESANLTYLILGLGAEAGEVQDKFAKAIRDGNGVPNTAAVVKELGDVLWFVASIADELDIDLAEVGQANIDKLQSRLNRNMISGSGDDR